MNFQIKVIFYVITFLILCDVITVQAQEYKVNNGASFSVYNSDIIDYDIPNILSPGQDYAVTITMVNNGNTKWTKGENFFLKVYSEIDNQYQSDVWGVSSVEIPHDVFPSDKVIFLFRITAPKTAGDYNFRWAMVKDLQYYGEYTNNIINVSGNNVYTASETGGSNSEFISFSVPERMNAGEKYKVRITMKNTGNTVWLPASSNEYMLTPVVMSSDITYPEWNSTSVLLSNQVEPGSISDIEFYVTAPVNPGVYNLQWVMKKGDAYFGQKTNTAVVNVAGNGNTYNDAKSFNATCMEQKVPNSMSFNEFTDISITMSNTGSKTWIKGREQLVTIDAKKSVVSINLWNVGYIQLPENVEPGSSVTFNFKVKPTESGWQYFQCSMMTEDGNLFGSPSPSVEVIVSAK
ncbi:MAG TPA: NBR1-Ig-like domain-containing protein [Ignavibacteria bacterium]|nr:NBR1-Ig-like domain-containing protein [Ignavibacteria bacterium]